MMKYLAESYGRGGIYAKMVADSISNDGVRLSSIETCAPKFIDAEFEKHRMLSSNSSSSRAIPWNKLSSGARYMPFDVRKASKGMQGHESLDGELLEEFLATLGYMRDFLVSDLGHWSDKVHKQTLNRYIEAFSMQTKIVTGTEWSNFFNLRLDGAAQPEIQELARCIMDVMMKSVPKILKNGEWHLPYDIDFMAFNDYDHRRISAAGCARVSYSAHDGPREVGKDIKLAEMLITSKHMTPFEHQATPMDAPDYAGSIGYITNGSGITHIDRRGTPWSANFRRWVQYRQLLQGY